MFYYITGNIYIFGMMEKLRCMNKPNKAQTMATSMTCFLIFILLDTYYQYCCLAAGKIGCKI